MGRLVNYGVGEASDRLTILALKILIHPPERTAHFQAERDVLLTQVRARTLNGSWFAHVLELGAVNGQLWQAEDALRTYRQRYEKAESSLPPLALADSQQTKPIAMLAFKIQQLNDKRAELVTLINANAGDAVGGEEKVR